jgi:hypothetical protein
MGDNHQRGGIPIETLRLVDSGSCDMPRVEAHKILLLRTGAFLRAYVEGKRDYIVDALMPPSNLGWIEVVVTPQKPTNGEKKFDLKVIA